MAIAILVATYERLWEPPHVPGGPHPGGGHAGSPREPRRACGLLHGGAAESLNVRGAYLEVLGDAVSSGLVIVAGLVIVFTGWTRADAIAGALIALFILPRTWALLRQAVNVLLEGAPPHLDVTEIEDALRAARSVRRVHDLHVWTLTSGREAMSAHVVVEAGAPADRILEDAAPRPPRPLRHRSHHDPDRDRASPSHPDHSPGRLADRPPTHARSKEVETMKIVKASLPTVSGTRARDCNDLTTRRQKELRGPAGS